MALISPSENAIVPFSQEMAQLFVNSRGQPFSLVQIIVPQLPGGLTEERSEALSRMYQEYGQLFDLYHGQCNTRPDRDEARKFWNHYGRTYRNHRPNWTSSRMMPDRLSKLRKKIRDFGGNHRFIQTL